jgi:glutamyl-tRNA synthetase
MGGVRTALFNYLYAKKMEGDFILRIEDTDQARSVKGAEGYIIESLKWCGLTYDEGAGVGGDFGPYRQSERKDIYKEFADELIRTGHAYWAFDTPGELESERTTDPNFQYNITSRRRMKNSLTLSESEVESRLTRGEVYVVRFKIPEDEEVVFDDMIRGNLSVHTGELDDKVLFKSDGMPTYHLANVVDDHLMWISHVIRGEEWLPSLPLHILLYRAFGWELPVFAHLPLLLKPTGKGKLSKRDGDKMGFPVFPLEWRSPEGDLFSGYRESGYFPEAFVNMLALMGWNPGTERELFSLKELVEAFSLERVGKSGSRFDPDKARWFNHQYLQAKSNADLAKMYMPVLEERGIEVSHEKLIEILSLTKERVSFVSEFWDQTWFFFSKPETYDEKFSKKQWKESTPGIMQGLMDVIMKLDDFQADNLEKQIKQWIQESGYGMGMVMSSLRLALVGGPYGPQMFDVMSILGREEVMGRIEKALEFFKE